MVQDLPLHANDRRFEVVIARLVADPTEVLESSVVSFEQRLLRLVANAPDQGT
jgi:hypothetical protein